MPKLLVFQHVAYEILGTLDPLLREAGFRIRYVNFGRDPHAEPCLDSYDALIVLGGPMNVDELDRYPHLQTETEMIGDAIARGMPILGICLGAQLIARALGARVRRNPQKEIGWYDLEPTPHGKEDPVLGHLAECEKIFQWHGDTFDVPAGGVHLASSPTCRNQAFRYGRNVYGFQFHLEVDEPVVKRWLQVPVHLRELEALRGHIDPATILQETPRYMPRSQELSDRVFGSLIELFGARKRFVALPSR
jgi:GMP synthase (glutamine-hydrolysing)